MSNTIPTPEVKEAAEAAGWEYIGEKSWVLVNAGFTMNTGLIVGGNKALVIDPGAGPREAAATYDAIRAVTDLPLIVVNTHAHGDHFFGNDYFRARGVETIWAHHRTAERIAADGESQRELVKAAEPEMAAGKGAYTRIVVPDSVVKDKPVDLDLGGHTVTLFHLGRGHTDGDLLVSAGSVLFAGDIVEEGAPPSFEDSFPQEWQKVLGKLIAIDDLYTVIVPGHGRPVDLEFVRTQFHKLRQAILTCTGAITEQVNDYTKAVPVLPYGPVQSRYLLTRIKAAGSSRPQTAPR
jgi:glyoxylase-like metal-dependent hydrolase (beta-lactamase superfamily II)